MEQINGIIAFVRAAELGGFTRAAQVLGITSSGVGKSISRLEADLGVRLLQRTTRRISLTDDGALFFGQCRQLLEDLESARSQLSHRSVSPRGRLRVSMPMTIGKRLIVPYLKTFCERYPEVRMELSFSDRFVNLVEENIDVAIRIGALSDSSLVARAIGRQQIVTVAGAGLPGVKNVHTVDDLKELPILVFRMLSSRRERPWRFRDGEQVVEFHPMPSMLIDDGEALVASARAGLGVVQVPDNMVDDAIAAGDLVELLPAMRMPSDPINAVYVSQKHVPARIRAFIDFLAQLPSLSRAQSSAPVVRQSRADSAGRAAHRSR